MEEKLTDQEQARYDKLARYEELGVDPFGTRYDWEDRIVDINEKYGALSAEELEATPVRVKVAGRLIAIRTKGKAAIRKIMVE